MQRPVTRVDIAEAAARIERYVRKSPVLELGDVLGQGYDLSLKMDFTQPSGSFKVRGAFSLLTARQPTRRVVAASGGNFGIAVAYACSRLGLDATVFVPETSPAEKLDRIRDLGAEVRVVSGYYLEALAECESFVADTGTFMAHAYDQHEVVSGNGTAAMEIGKQLPGASTILVAVGGGGLIAGIASWCQDDFRVISCEPVLCNSYNAAIAAGEPVRVDVGGVASSSLGAAVIGEFAWRARGWIDESVLVEDGAIIEAQRWLWDEVRVAVEPSAATTMAVLLSGAYVPDPGEHVVAVLSGANFNLATF